VYPTVNNGAFVIKGISTELENTEIMVTSQTGQIIYTAFNGSSTSISVNLNNPSEGLYFVQIRRPDKVITRKIIVTR
jgi:hypothetical protein